jgi:glycosyltransferase involved in cell wall biosynthesis
LLFVGNDFRRKGRDFLLRVFEYVRDVCTLTVVSNEPLLGGYVLPDGAEWIRGKNRNQVLDIYRNSDLFVFPTQQDYLPQVLGEALATGLSCVAREIGGIRDLVHDNQTGYLMSTEASAENWAARIRKLAANPNLLRALSLQARQFAEEMLDSRKFDRLIEGAVNSLYPEPVHSNTAVPPSPLWS